MQAQSKVLGPFEVIQESGPEGRVLTTIPYANVRGSQVICRVDDNFARVAIGLTGQSYFAAAEVAIFGSVQGMQFCLKRQYVRAISGPMSYVIPDEEAFDQIIFRGRNMTGGRRGPPGLPGTDDPSAANGYSIQVQILIQPRGGLGPTGRHQGGA